MNGKCFQRDFWLVGLRGSGWQEAHPGNITSWKQNCDKEENSIFYSTFTFYLFPPSLSDLIDTYNPVTLKHTAFWFDTDMYCKIITIKLVII